jgi:signal transduction histidine kinase/CheY-like chemotaxis protein
MTARVPNDAGEPLTRILYDISQLLGSAEDAEARVNRALGRLRALVPFERCAVLEALPDSQPRLIVAPGTRPEDSPGLRATVSALFLRLVEAHGQVPEPPLRAGVHLAVPLVGLDEVVGVLFVEGPEGAYDERHVHLLSMVAAQFAAYFSMLRARSMDVAQTRRMAEARLAAETANRTKDEFLALVSHELRTPLGTILAWADALRSSETPAASRARAFEAIQRSVGKQAKLIDDLLQLSCIAAASMRLNLQLVEPSKLIRDALVALRPEAREKSIRLEALLDKTVAPLIADPQRLSQIVVRLVSNAIKFTPVGGSVDVRLERAGVMARIRVIDTGSGIVPEKLPGIFERFSQADVSTTRLHGGLGVGLSLVKELVELHGGRVRAQSAGEKQGTTFVVELPLVDASREVDAAGKVAEPLRGDERALEGIRVLLVDDEPDIAEVLQFALRGHGALVTLAASGAEALAVMALSTPDVIVSDITMPGVNGYELMGQIIAQRGVGAPPAAALSVRAAKRDFDRAIASGFRTLLAKPVDPQALVAAVAMLSKIGAGIARGSAERRRP